MGGGGRWERKGIGRVLEWGERRARGRKGLQRRENRTTASVCQHFLCARQFLRT